MPTLPDLSTLDALIAEAESDKRLAYEAADQEYSQTVAAIERVKALVQRRESRATAHQTEAREFFFNRRPTTTPVTPAAPLNDFPGLRPAIRESIAQRADRFDLDDVVHDIQSKYPHTAIKRVAISSELWRMNKQGAISILEPGSGNRPNVYKKEDKAG